MKSFFYGAVVAVGLLAISGCGDKEETQTKSVKMEEMDADRELSPEEEDEAVEALVRMLQEAGDDNESELDLDADSFGADLDSLTEEEQAELLAWEQEAAQWASDNMKLASLDESAEAPVRSPNLDDVDATETQQA